ncbi:MAG: hypothetical protein H6673_02880 [Anaerolineales bacterium]|nr:hypothetical protein [Anaerolineales bacterium]
MQGSFIINSDVESVRDRFVIEFVKRGSATVGREVGVAGIVNARRQFSLAIQGWEANQWIRPFLTRLEGHFERSEHDDYTRVVFSTRGLSGPLTFLSLLIPYTVIRAVLPTWEGVEPVLSSIALLVFSIATVPLVGGVLYWVERRTHRLLIQTLLAAYDEPPLE